jgi:hypothetical protein
MSVDPQTVVALLFVAAAVAILARRLTVWLRSGGESGCGSCGSCSASSKVPAKGLVSLSDFSLGDSAGPTSRQSAADNSASTPA